MEIIKKQNQTQSGPVSQVAWEALLTEEKCLYLKTKVCQYHKTVFEVYYMSIICLLNVYYNKPLKISESKKKKQQLRDEEEEGEREKKDWWLKRKSLQHSMIQEEKKNVIVNSRKISIYLIN